MTYKEPSNKPLPQTAPRRWPFGGLGGKFFGAWQMSGIVVLSVIAPMGGS